MKRCLKELFLSGPLLAALPLLAQHHHEPAINIAKPNLHPYVDPAGNREGHLNTDSTVNEARVYDFYQRQADYYMAQERVPELLPAFPGLDAGEHGHWGKHSQNSHEDGRWNDISMGPVWGQTVRLGKFAAGKAVALDLGSQAKLSTFFDPETLSYPMAWTGGYIAFDPYRWGTSRNATPVGDVLFKNEDKAVAWTRAGEELSTRYFGYYRHDGRAIFSYEVDGKAVLDKAAAIEEEGQAVFVRSLQFSQGFEGAVLSLGKLPEELKVVARVEGRDEPLEVQRSGGLATVRVPRFETETRLAIAISASQSASDKAAESYQNLKLTALVQGGPLEWPESVEVRGEVGRELNRPYVVDTITIPEQTGFDSVMQLTSVGFLENGVAIVATLAGELWSVSGLTDNLEKVVWKRFAAGLHQPIGMHIDQDGIFVLERGQITRVHDLNGDGEADFFENYANDFSGRDRSHTHSFGLARGSDGSFYFANWKDIYRTTPERTTDYFAYGVRNCMGVGIGASGSILFGPQEGTVTPASMVIEAHEGEFYGHPGDTDADVISPPLCYVPRGVDNSTGGFLHANDARWGPLSDHTIGLSYGYSTHYLVLRDESTQRHQGAVVPLAGDFQSGVMRGAFGPHDGQLYVTGIDGWGDYSVSDGCFQRVRYTGEAFREPVGFQVYENGIRIDFDVALEGAESTRVKNFFVQQWDYEYSPQYGSPEFSKRQPASLGHDRMAVRSVKLLRGGKSLFVEIPEIEPVMQMHVRMHLKGADGVAFKTDLFPSILELGKAFEAPGLGPLVKGKPREIVLRVREKKSEDKLNTFSGDYIEGARTIEVGCSGALKFSTDLIVAKPNEAIKLVFKNPDVMPHNMVFAKEGNLKKVGEAAFSMLNDPKALDKHYTPDMPEVIANTFIVQPGGSHTLFFWAPAEEGDHHFVCTFPGHWMSMNGIFRVSAE